jgi:hypothetical protein
MILSAGLTSSHWKEKSRTAENVMIKGRIFFIANLLEQTQDVSTQENATCI